MLNYFFEKHFKMSNYVYSSHQNRRLRRIFKTCLKTNIFKNAKFWSYLFKNNSKTIVDCEFGLLTEKRTGRRFESLNVCGQKHVWFGQISKIFESWIELCHHNFLPNCFDKSMKILKMKRYGRSSKVNYACRSHNLARKFYSMN